jgi:hypothetical protein
MAFSNRECTMMPQLLAPCKVPEKSVHWLPWEKATCLELTLELDAYLSWLRPALADPRELHAAENAMPGMRRLL